MNGPLPALPPASQRVGLRTAMGLTQAQAAAELGVSVRSYLRWEQGHCVPLPANLRRYAAQLQRWRDAGA